jgi:hypothetical protein
MVIVHELGHNLGMHHASTDPENDGIRNEEYGDFSDPMGKSRMEHGFNAPHADQMNWFDAYPGSLIPVTSSGVFDLQPLTAHPLYTGGTRALVIAKPDSRSNYYLSYRQNNAHDESLDPLYTRGVNIHTHTGRQRTLHVATLVDGEIFEDEANGITITQTGTAPDGSYVTVDVETHVPEPQVGISLFAGVGMIVALRRRRNCIARFATTRRSSNWKGSSLRFRRRDSASARRDPILAHRGPTSRSSSRCVLHPLSPTHPRRKSFLRSAYRRARPGKNVRSPIPRCWRG